MTDVSSPADEINGSKVMSPINICLSNICPSNVCPTVRFRMLLIFLFIRGSIFKFKISVARSINPIGKVFTILLPGGDGNVNIIPPNAYRPVQSHPSQRLNRTNRANKKTPPVHGDRRLRPDRRMGKHDYQYPIDLREGEDRRLSRRISITT